MPPIILAIESSCDETSASVISNGKLLNNIIASQSEHHMYGGVVPELASRDHIRRALPLTELVLKQANKTLKDINGIAYTQGPGLAGALRG